MCGIVAVIRRRASRPRPEPKDALEPLHAAVAELSGAGTELTAFEHASELLGKADRALRGQAGIGLLLARPDLAEEIGEHLARLDAKVRDTESGLDDAAFGLSPGHVEQLNAALVGLKDITWALIHDRLEAARGIARLVGAAREEAAVAAGASIQTALSALSRLEVRGRDSAGIHLLVEGHGIDLDGEAIRRSLRDRVGDALFTSMAARTPGGHLSIVYKVAAEIGELGDNVAALADAISGDDLLHQALEAPTARVHVLGHTRWASVGVVSMANAHPLNSEELEGDPLAHVPGPYVVSALNGDVDNHARLRQEAGLRIAPDITTDAKVIPVLVSRRLAAGMDVDEAFRSTVATFDGSVAIAAQAATHPRRLLLAQRGSGQGLYVGLAEDAYVVASEPYGLVEETSSYVRLEGESGGQIVALDADQAGTLEGITRATYDGRLLPVTDADVNHAEITTRDIDRRGYPHYLLKEISESPHSVRKTLRGKIHERNGLLSVELADEALSPEIRGLLASGRLQRVIVIGQGTAAVAAQAVAAAMSRALARTPVGVSSLPATELSGFALEDDMSDALVVAVSQSGTTTDTNRTVDLVRNRGARVVAIVNRRHSDLVAKADGVLYTSDGRDVEMSVASTKAFYAQVAAGVLLAHAVADATGYTRPHDGHEILAALRALPDALDAVLSQSSDAVVEAARDLAPSRRYWAVVGSGNNRIAAAEVRIKLSELCYKSIACDATEDKKHIDLSAEPLIIVCAAGLSGPTADDVAKEVAIYRAHKAAPLVIADAGEDRFGAACHVVGVPAVHPALGFVLSAMVGHLFGYHAALAIDAGARPLRAARAAAEAVAAESLEPGDGMTDRLAQSVAEPSREFFARLRSGSYNGHMEADTAVRIASMLRYAAGELPLGAYELEFDRTASPSQLLRDLTDSLTRGIDELTRPIDAIKHQAKTVTVGISRSEEALLAIPLVQQVLSVVPARDRVSYQALRTLAALDPAVAEVTGYTRYRVEGDPAAKATIHVVDRGGVAADLPSRTDTDPTLRGTKRGALDEREVTVAVGLRDGRTVIHVPETEAHRPTGLTLLHVRFHDRLPADVALRVLSGYRQKRLDALVNAVTETEPDFDDEPLADLSVVDLLVTPVLELAERWRL